MLRRAFGQIIAVSVVVLLSVSAAFAQQPAGVPVSLKAEFDVADPAAVGCVTVVGNPIADAKYTVNGKEATGPLKGMSYTVIRLDPGSALVKGKNVLVAAGLMAATPAGQPAPMLKVEAVPHDALEIRTGPALGAIGPDYFSVICRTNMPAELTVTATPVEPAGKESSLTQMGGFYHRLKVPLAAGTKKFTYTVTAKAGKTEKKAGPFEVNPPAFDGSPIRFVACGDSRTNAARWASVAAGILKAKPSFMAFSGDMVASGTSDDIWDTEFFTPAHDLLATVPTYAVIGNHEGNSAAYDELFCTPSPDGKARNWRQVIGNLLLIGIDGTQDWSPAGKNLAWMDEILKGSKEKFIVVMSHYPAYTSGYHAKYGEKSVNECRDFIMPLLAKYKVTALVAGHDHDYERSEPPADQGVPCIVSGGAGAPNRGQTKNPQQANPFSKVFAPILNYCVIEINGDTLSLKALDVNGNQIDEAKYESRKDGVAKLKKAA